MPRAVNVAEKREEFVGASIEVIAAEGLSAATLRRVAQQSGCTTGSLTHYFPNRNALLRDTLRAVHTNAGRRMEVAARAAEAYTRLRGVLLESLPLDDVRLKEWRVWLAFWSASMDDPELTAENDRRYDEWMGALRSLLAPIVKKADLDGETAALLAFIDGLGVGVARQFVGPKAMARAQKACEETLGRYLQRFGIAAASP